MRKLSVIAIVLLVLTLPALGQKIELGVSAGGYFPVNLSGVGNAVAVEGTFSYRLASVPTVAFYLDVPVVGTLNANVRHAGLLSSASYSALFVAPGLKLKLLSGFPISPWLAAGGGLAHYSPSSGLRTATGSDSTNTGVVDFGGGIDSKVAPFLSLRGEVRDFYSGGLGFNLATFNQRQHNIVATGGVVLRF